MWRMTSEITDEMTKKKRHFEQFPSTIRKKWNLATDSNTLNT